MHAIFWSYNGFVGDEFCFKPKTLAEKFAPGSRSVGMKFFSWLTQRGFGPGYFNNSGVYHLIQKSVFKTEAEMVKALEVLSKHYCVKVYDGEAHFKGAVSELRNAEKRIRKQNPY
jgi:hypothetical protein